MPAGKIRLNSATHLIFTGRIKKMRISRFGASVATGGDRLSERRTTDVIGIEFGVEQIVMLARCQLPCLWLRTGTRVRPGRHDRAGHPGIG